MIRRAPPVNRAGQELPPAFSSTWPRIRPLPPVAGVCFGVAAAAAACGTAGVLAVEGLAVGQDRVNLPGPAVRCALDPELVLPGVAAGGVALVGRGEAGLGQARLLGVDGVDVGDLDAEVVQAAAMARVLQQDELQRRLGNGEVRVAGADLGRLDAKQLGIEGDGFVDVADVEGELDTGHENLQANTSMTVYILRCCRACHETSDSVNIDTCRSLMCC